MGDPLKSCWDYLICHPPPHRHSHVYFPAALGMFMHTVGPCLYQLRRDMKRCVHDEPDDSVYHTNVPAFIVSGTRLLQ